MTSLRFAGELGHLVDPISVIARRPDGTGVAEIGLSIHRTLAGWFPTSWYDISGSSTPGIVREALERDETVILCELPRYQPRLWAALESRAAGVVKCFYTWDSSEIPANHAALLKTFDQVLVPSSTLLRDLQCIGIPAARLPLALDLRPFELLKPVRSVERAHETFRILSLAAYHPRKNHAATVAAVVCLLDEGFDVTLRIHSNLVQAHTVGLLEGIPARHAHAFQVTTNHLSIRGLQQLMLEADLLVSASGGETFNIGARQALASGMNIAVTRVSGHEDLHQLPGVYTIEAQVPVPAVYPEEQGQVFGTQHAPTVEEIVRTLRQAMTDRNESLSRGGLTAPEWDHRIARSQYRDTLLARATRMPDRRSTRRLRPDLILVGHDGGFFSLFNTFVSVKRHWENSSAFGRVLPDWSVSSIRHFWNIDSFESFCYGQPEDGNIFPRLFDGPANTNESELRALSEHPDRFLRAHTFNSYADPFLTYVNADRLYRSKGFSAWRQDMHEVVAEIMPNQCILNRVEQAFRRVPEDALVIGMHVRHPSHAIEQPGQTIPLVDDFIRVCRSRLEQETQRNPGRPLRVFLATDQEAVTEAFRSEFGDILVMLPDIERVSRSDDAAFAATDSKLAQGYQVQHLAAADSARWSTELAEQVIADAWGLARASEIFHTVSNVATAVSMVNPTAKMLQLRKGDSLTSALARRSLQESTSVL